MRYRAMRYAFERDWIYAITVSYWDSVYRDKDTNCHKSKGFQVSV